MADWTTQAFLGQVLGSLCVEFAGCPHVWKVGFPPTKYMFQDKPRSEIDE